MARQAGTDLGDVKTNTRANKPKVSDKISLYKIPPKKWITLRLTGPTFSYATYWIKSKKKDGKFTKFPVDSPSYDPATQEFDSTKYDPWLALWQEQKGVDKEEQLVQVNTKFYINAIVRATQKAKPASCPKPTKAERESGFKDKDSDTWTPVEAIAFPAGAVEKIKKLSQLNVHESKTGASKAYPVSHPKFGCDIRVFYDPDAAPASQYEFQLGGGKRTPLTEEEQAYLVWDLSDLANELTENQVRQDYEGWAKRMGIKTSKKRKHDVEELDEDFDDEDLGDDEDDEDDAPRGKKGKVKAKKAPAKKSKKVIDDDEDEDEDFDDEEDEDDEDEAPKSKKKAPAKKSKKVVDDEDEDDFDDEDEEEDEDSDDEDEDDFDDEDEDDEPPKKKGKAVAKKAPAKKAKRKSDDDEDEDEDEEDSDFDDEDEDEDEPPAKKKGKAVAKKASSKKRPADDEDDEEEDEDEDDDFDDEEDEEEDEPPRKKKAPAKKVAAKKKARR